MTGTTTDTAAVDAFIERWERSGAAERSNLQLFISELCNLIGVPRTALKSPDIRARKDRVGEILKTLVAMGQVREISDGQFLAG